MKKELKTENRLTLFLALIVILSLSLFYIGYFYIVNVLPDKTAHATFQKTNCVILAKKLSTRQHFMERYRADFLISYNVSDVQYNRWVSGNGLDNDFTRNRDEEEAKLLKYNIGAAYPCWFDPKTPQLSILGTRTSWSSAYSLIIPGLVAIIATYFFIIKFFRVRKNIQPRKKHGKKRRKN